MGLYNKYQVVILGSDNADGTGNPVEVTVWASGLYIGHRLEGKERKYAGGGANDGGMVRRLFKLKMIPFGYPDGSIEGHDFSVYLSLCSGPLSKRYKFIKTVTGINLVAADGSSQFWVGATASLIPVYVTAIDEEDDDNDNKVVTISFAGRFRGI